MTTRNPKKYLKVRSWLDQNTYQTYVFVGANLDDNVKDILKQVSKGQLSANGQRVLQNTFGASFKDLLGSKDPLTPIFVFSSIREDDNISWLKRKLYSHLHDSAKSKVESHTSIYLWLNKKVKVSPPLLQSFLNNAFKTDRTIGFDTYASYVKNFFGASLKNPFSSFIDRNQALQLIQDITYAEHAEPLSFKYAKDVYYEYINYNPLVETSYNDDVSTLNLLSQDALLLESFGLDDVVDDCINLVSLYNITNKKLVGKFFPDHVGQEASHKEYHKNTISFIDSIEEAEDYVYRYVEQTGKNKNTSSNSYVNFLHIRVNELNFNRKQDMEKLFETLTTSPQIPFIKLKALTNNYFKIHKDSVTNPTIRNNILTKWTEQAQSSQAAKISDTFYVLMKVQYTKDVYCTIVVFDNLCYDVKFSFGSSMRETQASVLRFLDTVDQIILNVQKMFPSVYIPMVDRDFFNKVTTHDDGTKILRWLTTNSIKSDKLNINFSNFPSIVQSRMSSFFNVIKNPNKNILHLQYKKVDNYLKYENIQVFITNSFVKDREEMIKRIVNEFVITRDDAEKELERWLAQNEVKVFMMGDKVFLKPRNDNYVNVKIKLTTSIDMNFNIEGVKNSNIQRRIILLLQALIDIANEKLQKPKPIEVNKVDAIVYDITAKSVTGKSLTMDLLGDLGDLSDDFASYDDFGDLFEDDDELKALEAEFLNQQPASGVAIASNTVDEEEDNNNQDEDAAMKSYFMSMLKSADRELIDYKVPKGDKSQKRYSTVCQWNDRRQPVVVNQDEFKKVKEYNKDIKYVKTGSTPELQEKNYYICPQVWCPKSKIALTYKDFKEKYNESCPDANIQEKPILLTNHYWGKGDNGLNREHFPGFLDAFTHPKKLCLPCCFKKEAKQGSKNMQKENMCKNQWNTEETDDEPQEVVGNEKYIKAEIVVPLEISRFGLLPKDLGQIVENTSCGNGLGGKGLMTDKTNCVLRKGVNQKSQSFLNALIYVLDNPNINNVSVFLESFQKRISVEHFVGLENGKVMKLFINKEFDIHDKKNFQQFVAWFLHPKQDTYIKMFRLFDIAKELNITGKEVGMFDINKLKNHKTILREFLIYNAFTHFVRYMADSNIEKDYQFLIDYIQNEGDWLNVNNYNVMVIEHDPSENKTYIICPFNRNASSAFSFNNHFVILLKQNDYYEPICHVQNTSGDLKMTTKFLYKQAPHGIKRLIKFYMQNCSVDEPKHSSHDIELLLASLGLNVKYHVIDYSFRVCGLLVDKYNLFVPLKEKVDIYNLKTEFIYYDEVSRYKCTLTKEEIQMAFHAIYQRTKDTFYKLSTIITSADDTRIVGIILQDDLFVPINYKEDEDIQYINDILQDNLNIFIDNEISDARVVRISKDLQRRKYYQLMTNEIMDYMKKYPNIQNEVSFLTDTGNPFPKEYVRKKLLKIVRDMVVKSKMNRSNDILHFTSQYVEDLLQSSGRTQNVILKQMYGIQKKFKKAPFELLFDQKDVIEGKLLERVKIIQNPYVTLMERVDRHLKDYVFEGIEPVELENFSRYFNSSTTFEDVPYKFRKLLQRHMLIAYDNYNFNTIYDVFLSICKYQKLTNITDIGILRDIIYKRVASSYKQNNIEMLTENPSFIYNEKMMKIKKRNLETIAATLESTFYFPSLYEVYHLSSLAKINVIIIGRKTKDNADGVEMYFNNSSKYILLEHSYDRFTNKDVFKIVVKEPKGSTPKIIMKKSEVSQGLLQILSK